MQKKGNGNDHEKPAKCQKMVAAGKLELELVRARAEDKEARVELQQALEDRDEAVRIATRQSMNTIPVHTIARNANAGQQYEYAPFVSHSVDQREMHWQGVYAPQQPYSAVLHRILTIVKS